MEPSKTPKRPFGAPRRGLEQVYLTGVTAEFIPSGDTEGVDASLWDAVSWQILKPAGVDSYTLDVFVYSEALESWILAGYVEDLSGLSWRLIQEAGCRVAIGIESVVGTFGDGFSIAYFPFNRA